MTVSPHSRSRPGRVAIAALLSALAALVASLLPAQPGDAGMISAFSPLAWGQDHRCTIRDFKTVMYKVACTKGLSEAVEQAQKFTDCAKRTLPSLECTSCHPKAAAGDSLLKTMDYRLSKNALELFREFEAVCALPVVVETAPAEEVPTAPVEPVVEPAEDSEKKAAEDR